jgi:hypothetical protein
VKREIHTTLSIECHDWLYEETHRRSGNLNEVIEGLVAFYRKNKDVPEQFISARFFLKQLIKEELMGLDLPGNRGN